MSISYNKLWKMLVDRNMNKTELRTQAKISTNAIAKMGKMSLYQWIQWIKSAKFFIAISVM